MQKPDFYKEPFKEWCSKCKEYVISLNGHCINNDEHVTCPFTDEELLKLNAFKKLPYKRIKKGVKKK